MRGGTLIQEIKRITFDDVQSGGFCDENWLRSLSAWIEFIKTDFSCFDGFDYFALKEVFLGNLRRRVGILRETYKNIFIQLTGGGDSRLVFSMFLEDKESIGCYVYGDGRNQDRLIFEMLTRFYGIKRAANIPFRGKPLTTRKLMAKALIDSNFQKFNNLNTYANSAAYEGATCKITGYYGVNVCGGVRLPPNRTELTTIPRTRDIDSALFSYGDYLVEFASRYKGQRQAHIKDMFYVNNRGPSHYAAHSLADNIYCSSFDILYDPVNICLVKAAPYLDSFIDRSVLSVDLIADVNEELALFPYNDRAIPHFRKFKNIPIVNCFDGYMLREMDVQPFAYCDHVPDLDGLEFLGDDPLADVIADPRMYRFMPEGLIGVDLGAVPRTTSDNIINMVIGRFVLDHFSRAGLAMDSSASRAG